MQPELLPLVTGIPKLRGLPQSFVRSLFDNDMSSVAAVAAASTDVVNSLLEKQIPFVRVTECADNDSALVRFRRASRALADAIILSAQRSSRA